MHTWAYSQLQRRVEQDQNREKENLINDGH